MHGLTMATMKTATAVSAPEPISFATPWVGTFFTVSSGLVFAFLTMILPLVGKAAKAVPHYEQNRKAFLAVVFLSLLLAGLAAFSKLARRKVDGSPLPWASFLLVGLDVLLLIAYQIGALAI